MSSVSLSGVWLTHTTRVSQLDILTVGDGGGQAGATILPVKMNLRVVSVSLTLPTRQNEFDRLLDAKKHCI